MKLSINKRELDLIKDIFQENIQDQLMETVKDFCVSDEELPNDELENEVLEVLENAIKFGFAQIKRKMI